MSKKKSPEPFVKPAEITELVADSHAHLFDDTEAKEIISCMQNDGIEIIVNMAGSIDSARFASKISKESKNIYYMFGLHPYDTDCYNEEYIRFITNLSKEDRGRLVGLGEIGLDYHVESPTKEEQIFCFVEQLKLADKLSLPVSLHIRDAHEDAIKILNDNKNLLNNSGIIHCFSGGEEEAKEYLNLGFMISMSGAITFKRKDEQLSSLEKALLVIPKDKLLIETDSPFLCPVPYRGKKNEPKYVLLTAMHIASVLERDVNEIIKETKENLLRVLKIKKD